MEHDKVAALRRVAIVLSSLPDATAGRLMSGLAADQQRAVRMALSDLADVDPLERRRALDGFATSIRRGRSSLAGQNDAAEIVLSKVALQLPDSRRDPAPRGPLVSTRTTAPLALLSDVDDDSLVEQVREEHPQTIAIILGSLSPAQAARILPKLNVTTRTEAMRRLAKLDTPSPELIDDIGNQLKNKLLAAGARFGAASPPPAAARPAASTTGQAALQAILDAMSSAEADTAPPTPAAPAQGEPMPSARAAANAGSAAARRQSYAQESGADEPAIRLSEQTWPVAEQTWPGAESPERIHARLVATATPRLREALAAVPTRQSLLALCGLPSATAEKVLGSLPRRQARQIRQQIIELGTLELREIDRAKEAVAHAIDQLELAVAG